MKILLVSLLGICALSSVSFASEEASQHEVVGRGHAMSMCDTLTFTSCQMLLQQQSNDQGARDTETQCQLSGGHLDSPYVQCTPMCNPMIAPPYVPGQPPTFTTCDSTCYATCIDNRQAE